MDRIELEKYCKRMEYVAGESASNKDEHSSAVIIDYYKRLSGLYRKFHSDEGAMHMPINYSSDASHKSKLLYQVNYVQKLLKEHQYTKVLELGCGMGYNTLHLSKANPEVNFKAMDLSLDNIEFAKGNSHEAYNSHFFQGDFDDFASKEAGEKFDLIFAVETLCYSKNLNSLIKQLQHHLNENGRIVIFDGFVRPGSESLKNQTEIKAYNFLTWGFAVREFKKLQEIIDHTSSGLEVIEVSDYSNEILSNYQRFEKGAKNLFVFPSLMKALLKVKIISLALFKHICAGIMGTYFLNSGYLGYYKLELLKVPSQHGQ